jgi:hypothetical protein
MELSHTATACSCNLQIPSVFAEIFALPIMAGLIVGLIFFFILLDCE